MVCTPRQVSADVSSAIDSVIVRALLQRTTRQGPPIQSPAAFADAHRRRRAARPAPRARAPGARPATEPRQRDGYGGYPSDPNDSDTWQYRRAAGHRPLPGAQAVRPVPSARARVPARPRTSASPRRGISRALLTVVVVLVLAVIAVTVWAVGLRTPSNPSANRGTGAQAKSSSGAKPPATAAGTVLKPVTDSTFNIYGTPPGNTEDSTLAIDAIDGNATTGWATSYYFGSPKFGGLKPGTGLLINMGKQVRLSQVKVLFGPGADHRRDLPRQLRAVGGDVEQRAVVIQAGLASGDGHRQPRRST